MTSPLHGAPIDHVELMVPDRHAAAAWYRDVLGLIATPEDERWANENPAGPLIISADGGRTSLALFEGPSGSDTSKDGIRRVAFRASGDEFVAFVEFGRALGLTPMRVIDHETQISVYFSDPYGHALEVTTHDHKRGRAAV